jgi:hypothetical protein
MVFCRPNGDFLRPEGYAASKHDTDEPVRILYSRVIASAREAKREAIQKKQRC